MYVVYMLCVDCIYIYVKKLRRDRYSLSPDGTEFNSCTRQSDNTYSVKLLQ